MKYYILIILMLSGVTIAGEKDSYGVSVEMISVWGDSGTVMVQTNPKHNVDGLICESNYWLELSKDHEGYEAMLSLLIASQMAGKNITVRAVDDMGSDFCRLHRVITYQ